MNKKYVDCPVCGKHRFPSWEDNGICICPYCGWGHDTASEEDIHHAYGPNDLSLEHHRLRYEYYVSQNPDYYWRADKYPVIPQIEKCLCPVCREFQFEPLAWEDIYCGVTPADVLCLQCGWHYDEVQMENPEIGNRTNEMSVSEYKNWYADKLRENPNYRYFDEVADSYNPKPHKCPVCGRYEFEDEGCYGICPFCGWEDDGVQSADPDHEGGANELSLNQYRMQYTKRIQENPNYKWKKHGM